MKALTISILVLLTVRLGGQHTISGTVNGDDNEGLVGATVVLLDHDSTMVTFALTNGNGNFELDGVPEGKHIIQATYLSFTNYSQALQVSKSETLTPIVLQSSSEVLQEITIKAEHIPMGLKGDTISYNAAAFKTRPNATVEDLLKKLPGVEVDRNGNIKAQGEEVNNVLVDGKEFFGSDPKMATKNLPAEAVDKVEVYDKKSDIAEFTGVDDGNEEKTINLKLKEDHKKGGFGNVLAAAGRDSTYESKLNYFRFTPSLQVSIIFAANNINKETFSINDRIDFMGGMMEAMSGGKINLSDAGGLQDGLNRSLSSGVNLNYDLTDKIELLSHYVVNQINNTVSRMTETVGFSDKFAFSNEANTNSELRNLQHQINTKLKYKVTPLFEVIFKNNFSWSDQYSRRNSFTSYFRDNLDSGFSSSNFTSNKQDWNYDSNLLVKNKFMKKGRNLISSLTFKKGNEDASEVISNVNRIEANNFTLYQNQLYSNAVTQTSGKMDFTEPLTKKVFMGAHYQYGNSLEKPIRLFDEFAVDFRKNYVYNLAGFSIRRNTNNLKMGFSLKGQHTQLTGVVSGIDEAIRGRYTHLLPSFNLDYDIGRNRSLTSSLYSRVNAPDLEQLAPIQNNIDPNYKFVGNPNLRPSLEHRLSLGYNYFDNFNFTNFWARLDLTRTQDRIVMKTEIDGNLFRTATPINTDKYFAVSGFMNFSRPFKPLKINYKIRSRLRYAKYESFLNNLPSLITDASLNLRFSINNRKTKYFSLESGTSWQISAKSYAINENFNQVFSNTNLYIDSEFYLPRAWIVASKFEYTSYSNEQFSEASSFALWSASISKFFLDNKLELRLSAFDLLNQNIGINRYGTENSLVEDNFNNLSRYVMLGLNYKIGSGKKPGMRILID